MELWDVRVTDEGVYECILKDESKKTKTLTLYLKVTGKQYVMLTLFMCVVYSKRSWASTVLILRREQTCCVAL